MLTFGYTYKIWIQLPEKSFTVKGNIQLWRNIQSQPWSLQSGHRHHLYYSKVAIVAFEQVYANRKNNKHVVVN